MSGRFSRLEFDGEERKRRLSETHAELHGTPKRDAAHYMTIANDSRRLGLFEHALQNYTRAVREDRATVAAWVGQVQMLVELGELAEARLWADKALELFRDNGELLASKAQTVVRQGDRPGGIALSDASLRSPGSSPWRWEVRGEVLVAGGEPLYRTCFQKAAAEPGADWFDQTLIATMLLLHRQAAAALEYAQRAVAQQATAPYAWLVLGRCHAALAWDEQAETTFERCLELTPRLEAAELALAAIRQRGAGGRFVTRLRNWFRR
ncbi:MAG: hypothetical protein U0572_14970 [Phycisphaerales bacterium]